MRISDEQRMERSLRARKMHADGRLGNRAVARKAGKKSAEVRSRRASDLAQRLVEQNADAMAASLKRILKTGTPSQQLRAVEALLKLGLSAERLEVSERRDDHAAKSREELVAILSDKLINGPAASVIRAQLEAETIPDAQVVEID